MSDKAEKCIVMIRDSSGDLHRCPYDAWKKGFCKIHHPDSVKARNEKYEKLKKIWEENRTEEAEKEAQDE